MVNSNSTSKIVKIENVVGVPSYILERITDEMNELHSQQPYMSEHHG
ncbi:hypothetical protein SAMN05421640_3481 [Ekhidna lutea]|uniref:Uncharacterized protein n=2 Tax=Ekhidna lutea TaxID=447679 RepID=A0A239LYG2_EKHLU|nr:hypothetical protein SAMN05421640_3481 [Ekhidna lutea]